VAHWIGLVNGFSNPVSKISEIEIYTHNGSAKGKYISLVYKTREAKGLSPYQIRISVNP
jgi:hypothetical protein